MFSRTSLRSVILVFGLGVSPLAMTGPSGFIGVADAWCGEAVGWSCCPELDSHCFPEGCEGVSCMIDDRYARTDGKPCSAQ